MKTDPRGAPVHTMVKEHDGATYVFAVMMHDQEAEATITFLAPERSRDRLPTEARPGLDEGSGVVTIKTPNPTAVLNRLTGWALEQGVELEALAVERPSLEDIYLQLTEEDA